MLMLQLVVWLRLLELHDVRQNLRLLLQTLGKEGLHEVDLALFQLQALAANLGLLVRSWFFRRTSSMYRASSESACGGFTDPYGRPRFRGTGTGEALGGLET